MVTPFPKDSSQDTLAALRDRLDVVDAQVHKLLRERFEIVSEIGAAKGPDESVIRPARESAVIENRLSLHTGPLPRDVLVHIWRVLIGAACLVQRPYRVHVAGPIDVARYLYGPIPMTLADPLDAVAALETSPGDLAIIDGMTNARWWSGRGAAHVIGRFPQSDGGSAIVVGGPGVSPGTGPLALVVRGDADPIEISASDIEAEDEILGRYHPFPFAIPVAQSSTSSPL